MKPEVTETTGADVSYMLIHRKNGSSWFKGRGLGSSQAEARAELDRVRAYAKGNETGVEYKVVRTDIRTMPW
jgi:hypothetical protein